ncbi:MAG TPA: molybdenum cofactor guanylyltransferase, partial [Actinomycetota bacterium]|nr:molybdenum cofactor guanylyltransferase [Actinomycetota bacterium]
MNDLAVSGLLLTGGTSRRMGADKARQLVGGQAMGALAGRALLKVAGPVLSLGPDPGLGLEPLDDPRRGPLAALAAGLRHLANLGLEQPVLLLACDLPFVTPGLLRLVTQRLGGGGGAVPTAQGRLQPLAACYSPAVLPVADRLVSRGVLSMRALLDEIEVNEVPEAEWRRVAGPRALDDVDTRRDM